MHEDWWCVSYVLCIGPDKSMKLIHNKKGLKHKMPFLKAVMKKYCYAMEKFI
jgi:hypothetical protein